MESFLLFKHDSSCIGTGKLAKSRLLKASEGFKAYLYLMRHYPALQLSVYIAYMRNIHRATHSRMYKKEAILNPWAKFATAGHAKNLKGAAAQDGNDVVSKIQLLRFRSAQWPVQPQAAALLVYWQR